MFPPRLRLTAGFYDSSGSGYVPWCREQASKQATLSLFVQSSKGKQLSWMHVLHGKAGSRCGRTIERPAKQREHEANHEGSTAMLRAPKSELVAAPLLTVLVTAALFDVAHSSRTEALRQRGRKPASPRVCTSAACSRLAALISQAANASAQPCVDFHEYVCGGWDHRARPLTVAEYAREAFIENVAQRSRSAPLPELQQTAEEKAARYFTACDDVVSGHEDHLDDVKRLLLNGGITWPDNGTNFDFLDAMFYMSLVARVPILLRLSLRGDATSETILISRAMPTFLVAARLKREMRAASAKKFFRTLYVAFSTTGRVDVDGRFAVLADQENRLVSSLNAAQVNAKSATATTSDIHHWAKGTSKQRWRATFYKYWRIASNVSVPVTIENRDYFWAVFSHHRRFGDAQTMDLFGWLCVQALFPFTNRKIVSSYYASPDVQIKHRNLCFHQTDRIMHYAFQSDIARDICSESLVDDVTSLVARISHSIDDTVTTGWLFFGECLEHDSRGDRFTSALAKYETNYTAQAYASFPDMTGDPLVNWIEAVDAVPDTLRYLLPAGELALGEDVRAGEPPIEPAYLDVPWYALDAPLAVKLAGLGSRVAGKVFRELLSPNRACRGLRDSAERLWSCIVAREQQDSDLSDAARDDVLVSVLSSGVLWPVLRDLVAGNGSVLATVQSLSEAQLFFVVGCLLLCGEEHSEAKCNLPLKDNVRFAHAFSCPRGAPMHPRRTCSDIGFSALAIKRV
ncbi:endothelin-converting enzyme 1-like [Dermacentor albipictus]|uniref:endothelin-converting enzyme 1-like n=1 Tax=Dermacentor albipictus TaxID=60249 RepID=UPI0031FC609A